MLNIWQFHFYGLGSIQSSSVSSSSPSSTGVLEYPAGKTVTDSGPVSKTVTDVGPVTKTVADVGPTGSTFSSP